MLDNIEQGKIWKPFQKVTLCDIMKAYSLGFIMQLNMMFASMQEDNELYMSPDDEALSPEILERVEKKLAEFEIHLKFVGLSFSHMYLESFRSNVAALTYGDLAQKIDILNERVDDELKEVVFGFVPKDRSLFLNNKELFGKEVNNSFPSAANDIIAAGNCYAHGLHTACVFHLMRVVEIGAKNLVSKMRAGKYILTPVSKNGAKEMVKKPIELCDWGTLIKGFESALRESEKGTKTNTKKKETLAFYSHAVGVFRNFKDAWRNNVSHTRKVYKAGETKDIMDNTRQFMQHLARRVKEKK
ncbi:MAG: hypothetical protein R2681_11410 [Pyrinomonadaceae bacterium]